nr:phage integrase N-terminal domain-containing protein [Ralstonia mannitolilytica]
MDDLTYTLRQLCQRNRDGSHATQADRQRSLILAARQLREASFRQMRATSLKGKHVGALLQRWQAEGLSVGTLKNRMAHLRWGGGREGRQGRHPASGQHQAGHRGPPLCDQRKQSQGTRRWAGQDHRSLRSHEPALASGLGPAAGRVHQVPTPLCRPRRPHRWSSGRYWTSPTGWQVWAR